VVPAHNFALLTSNNFANQFIENGSKGNIRNDLSASKSPWYSQLNKKNLKAPVLFYQIEVKHYLTADVYIEE
jgi:hypothetical protein